MAGSVGGFYDTHQLCLPLADLCQWCALFQVVSLDHLRKREREGLSEACHLWWSGVFIVSDVCCERISLKEGGRKCWGGGGGIERSVEEGE